MRGLVCGVLVLCPGLVSADTYHVAAPPHAVTVFPQGALVEHRFSVDVPEGAHTILMPSLGDVAGLELAGSATLVSVGHIQSLIDPDPFYSDAQTGARAAVVEAKKDAQAADEALALQEAQIAALDTQITFLSSVTAAAETLPTPDQLTALSGTIGIQIAELSANVILLSSALPELEDAVDNAGSALVRAEQAFARTAPPSENLRLLSLDIVADAATEISGTFLVLEGAAGWTPSYDVFLADGDAPLIAMSRKAEVYQSTGQSWSDVSLTLSTIFPFSQLDGSVVQSNFARIFDPKVARRALSAEADGAMMSARQDAPMMEPLMVVEEMITTTDGPAFVYGVPGTVSLISGDATAQFALGELSFDATTEFIAAPRFDDTAYLTAKIENTTVEPILAGQGQFFRDGVLVGEKWMHEVLIGEEATLHFGAEKGLQLDYRVADRLSGDRGILNRSNTRDEVVEFDVTNLTSAPKNVRAIYALPVSEQEDLDIDITAAPTAGTLPYEDARGVGAWEITLEPGETQTVRIEITLTWPEGQSLQWRP